jgi:hypothetical protein
MRLKICAIDKKLSFATPRVLICFGSPDEACSLFTEDDRLLMSDDLEWPP